LWAITFPGVTISLTKLFRRNIWPTIIGGFPIRLT
jgi:hypothetical protein